MRILKKRTIIRGVIYLKFNLVTGEKFKLNKNT